MTEKEADAPDLGRREFLRTLLRWGAALAVGGGLAGLARPRAPACDELCATCPQVGACPFEAGKLKLTVDRNKCVGCGRCVHIAPKTFALDAQRKAKVINARGDSPQTIARAIRECPVKAIGYR